MPGLPGDDFDPNDVEDFSDDDFRDAGGLPLDEGYGDDADNPGSSGGDQDRTQPTPEGVVEGRDAEAEVRQPSRDERRSAVLARERAELRAERDALARQLAEVQQGSNQQRQQEEARRLAEMEPWERAEHIAAQSARSAEQAVQQLNARLADIDDRATFAAQCAANPALAKIKDQVEATLAESRRNGVSTPREVVAYYLLGKSIAERGPKARAVAERRGAVNVNRERARPVTSGSDVPSGRAPRDERQARIQRLENATI